MKENKLANNVKINDSELRFLSILWEHSPVNSTELVRLCEIQLGWKKSTTYTVIRRLSERGVVENQNAVVTALIPKEQVQQNESQDLIQKVYGGSVKLFLAAFLKKEKLSQEEAESLKELIDNYTEGK